MHNCISLNVNLVSHNYRFTGNTSKPSNNKGHYSSNSFLDIALLSPATDHMTEAARMFAKDIETSHHQESLEYQIPDKTQNETLMIQTMSLRAQAVRSYETTKEWESPLTNLMSSVHSLIDHYTAFWQKVSVCDDIGDIIRSSAVKYKSGTCHISRVCRSQQVG